MDPQSHLGIEEQIFPGKQGIEGGYGRTTWIRSTASQKGSHGTTCSAGAPLAQGESYGPLYIAP
jgi:hypothetical protein